MGMSHFQPDREFTHLTTPRLTIRRFVRQDLRPFVAYRSDPMVARYQGWEAPFPMHSGELLISGLSTTHPGTPGLWFQFAVSLRGDDQLVGDCAARPNLQDPGLVEIGFTFATAHQGRGYATEAVRRLLQYLFTATHQRTPAHRVSATCAVRNVRSANLLQRVGMRREGHHVQCAWYGNEWTSEDSYALLRREWLDQPPPTADPSTSAHKDSRSDRRA